MTKKQFWQTASNWGFLGGIGLFVMNIISWLLKLEAGGMTWIHELLMFLVICPMILYTGRRNASAAKPSEGYPYGRAVGFVFAMMMFAGIVYGVGLFLMYNFIAADYYGPMIETTVDGMALTMGQVNPSMLDFFIENREMYLSMMRNPFMLIFSSVINTAAKGGFLGLVLCAFVYRRPDIFAPAPEKEDNDEEQA